MNLKAKATYVLCGYGMARMVDIILGRLSVTDIGAKWLALLGLS